MPDSNRISFNRVSLTDIVAAFRGLSSEHARRREVAERATTWRLIRMKLAAPEQANGARWAWSLRIMIPAAAVGALALTAHALREPAPLAYHSSGATVSNGLIESEKQNAVLDFSDGSHVEMEKGSATRVEVVGPHAARTLLAHGVLEVSVHHERDTDYRFLAGPYEVRVIGTKFRLAWRPDSSSFSIAMHEGRVRVIGPAHFERTLTTGESLQLSQPEVAVATTARAPASAAAPFTRGPTSADGASSAARSGVARADVPSARPALASTENALATSEAPAWPSLIAKGRFNDVVDAARGMGTERALRERSAADLNALAHAAHYTGYSSLAQRAWTTLRERFAGQRAAHQAAFFLGRLCDQQGRTAEALRWLNTYLAESSRDVYVSEALGRKLTVVQKLQGGEAARSVAREYLQRFPSGPYARTARELLGG